jgi:hypothetical protein
VVGLGAVRLSVRRCQEADHSPGKSSTYLERGWENYRAIFTYV